MILDWFYYEIILVQTYYTNYKILNNILKYFIQSFVIGLYILLYLSLLVLNIKPD